MEEEHVIRLINKVHKHILNELKSTDDISAAQQVKTDDFTISYNMENGKVSGVKYFNDKSRIEMRLLFHARELDVHFIVLGTHLKKAIKFLPLFLKWLSPAYRSWRSMSKSIEKVHNHHADVLSQKIKREETEKFMESYHETFPEELNDILLGDDGDS